MSSVASAALATVRRAGSSALSRGKEAKKNETRITLAMSPQSMDRLNQLLVRCEAGSKAEIIRNALRLYEAVIDETEKGNGFCVKTPEGDIIQYRMFM